MVFYPVLVNPFSAAPIPFPGEYIKQRSSCHPPAHLPVLLPTDDMDPSQFEKMFSQANYIMGPFADMILRPAQFPPANANPLVVLDEACGSGVVASHIMSNLSPDDKSRLDLTCADISEPAIMHMKGRIENLGWKNARAVTNDAMVRTDPCLHAPAVTDSV